MNPLKIYAEADISQFITPREGETKFGETIQLIKNLKDLNASDAHYVIFGIPEDIGVRANHGKAGTSTAWKAFLTCFLNIQKNAYNQPENCVLLGEIDCRNILEKAAAIATTDGAYYEKLGVLVGQLDVWVSTTIAAIVAAGKTPIIIGGGHNNAYGNIKGTSMALKKPIHILNIDAHTDLRKTEHRHSGNGFSYAIAEGFLHKYHIYGLHKNYTSANIFKKIENNDNLAITLFEDLISRNTAEKAKEIQKAADSLKNTFGLEVDCDAIAHFPSSAITPSGFTLEEVRYCLQTLKNNNHLHYLHLCEASAKNEANVGKALAYLVSDFVSTHP